jgi:hypothetical protein
MNAANFKKSSIADPFGEIIREANPQMVNERAAGHTHPPGAFDQRQLLLVLGRAIDEEVAAGMSGDRLDGIKRDRMRLEFLRSLTSRIRETSLGESAVGEVRAPAVPVPSRRAR